MGIFEKLKKAKQPAPKENVDSEAENKKESTISEAELRQTLKGFLYSEDLVEEMLPTFRKLYEQEGFKDVVELIQAKETELNNINGNKEHFEQVTEPNDEPPSDTTEENDGEDYLMSILNDRYGE